MTIPPTRPAALLLQYYDEATAAWVTLDAHDLGSIPRSRRFAGPPGRPVSARLWRLIKAAGWDWGSAVTTVRQVTFRVETGLLSPARRWAFNFDTATQRYGLVATAGNAEIYRGSDRMASLPLPYTADQINRVRRAQALDTLIAFLSSVQPHRIQRQGAHTEWDIRPQAFEHVPLYDYDGTNAGAVNEVQQLEFVSMAVGETFNITLEDETTGTIAYVHDMASLATSVRTALEALAQLGAGKVTVTSPADKKLTVTFLTGVDMGSMTPLVVSSNEGHVRQVTITQGVPGGEPVISNTRGWPGDGCFFEERLVLAGLASRPGVLLASRQGRFNDLKVRGNTVGRGIDVNVASDQSTRILALWPGAQLQAFTESAQYYCPGPPLTNPPAFQRSSEALGIEPNTPLFDLAGGVAFLAAGGDALALAAYSEAVQNYAAVTLSDHHAHLVKGVVDWAVRGERSTRDPAWGALVRSDGALAFMTAMVKQEVIGFSRWTTDGAFVAAGAELKGDLFVIVRRAVMIAGVETERLFYERVDDGAFLDGSSRGEGPAAGATGLWHLEGRRVAIYVDGADQGDQIVTAGAVTFDPPCERTWEVGRLFVPRGVSLPIPRQQDPRAGASVHARAGEIAVRMGTSAGLKVGMHGKRLWPLKEKTRPVALLDQGPGEDAFGGWSRVYPVPGFQHDSQVEFQQDRPGPLELMEWVVTVDT